MTAKFKILFNLGIQRTVFEPVNETWAVAQNGLFGSMRKWPIS